VNLGLLSLLAEDPVLFVVLALGLIEALALHEYAHALTADLQGDRMPRAMGRLTLNPIRHLDPLGTVFIFLVGFGWAKPVEFRPSALASKRFGAALVALAGPAMNLVLAVVASALLVPAFSAGLGLIANFLASFASVNLLLAVFNLIPLPPLDGSRLLTIFLPPDKQKIIFFLDRYGFLILLALLFFGGFAFLQPLLCLVGGAIGSLTGSGPLLLLRFDC
jgi:Zn-dependent protease